MRADASFSHLRDSFFFRQPFCSHCTLARGFNKAILSVSGFHFHSFLRIIFSRLIRSKPAQMWCLEGFKSLAASYLPPALRYQTACALLHFAPKSPAGACFTSALLAAGAPLARRHRRHLARPASAATDCNSLARSSPLLVASSSWRPTTRSPWGCALELTAACGDMHFCQLRRLRSDRSTRSCFPVRLELLSPPKLAKWAPCFKLYVRIKLPATG